MPNVLNDCFKLKGIMVHLHINYIVRFSKMSILRFVLFLPLSLSLSLSLAPLPPQVVITSRIELAAYHAF